MILHQTKYQHPAYGPLIISYTAELADGHPDIMVKQASMPSGEIVDRDELPHDLEAYLAAPTMLRSIRVDQGDFLYHRNDTDILSIIRQTEIGLYVISNNVEWRKVADSIYKAINEGSPWFDNKLVTYDYELAGYAVEIDTDQN